jgi:hypothetical protein
VGWTKTRGRLEALLNEEIAKRGIADQAWVTPESTGFEQSSKLNPALLPYCSL